MKKQFIRLQNMRYRITSVKRYEPFERHDVNLSFGIYIYFSMTGQSGRVYHMFKTLEERDDVLLELDQIFGV